MFSFSRLTDRFKLFAFIFLATILTFLYCITIGVIPAILVSILLIAILLVTRTIWLPENNGKSAVRKSSLVVMLTIVSSFSFWNSFIESIAKGIINYVNTSYNLNIPIPSDVSPILIMIFALLVIFIVNYFNRDTTVMGKHSTPIDDEFPEKSYKEKLIHFCSILEADLSKIDRETNWSAYYFTPLEAQVEIHSNRGKKQKKIKELIPAIRADKKSKSFLILGDPGGGKSVALRKLCRDLLKEVHKTHKVPIYINLKEWKPSRTWSDNEPPRYSELNEFVISNLKERLNDIFSDDFIDNYFEKMIENGRIFFVLDSFDEIPAVLDVDESSQLIKELSYLIYKFIAVKGEVRGILASRLFRKPSEDFKSDSVLEIRPFTEHKIRESLKKSMENLYTIEFERGLFNKKEFLIPSARNPFTTTLIASYAKNNASRLPDNQAQLYSNYIITRLNSCDEKLKKKQLDAEMIINCCKEISYIMFVESNFGLEAPIEVLEKRLPQFKIRDIIEILKYSRLGRLGDGDDNKFSFVHRRFNEYFIVQKLIESPELVYNIYKNSIPTDSRWRDALVLYCEVADEKQAEDIAQFCWSEIKKIASEDIDMRDSQYMRSIHSLRFLKEAFRARKDLIDDFADELYSFVINTIKSTKNLLQKKLVVEAIGLLKDNEIDVAILNSLSIGNRWIGEIAIRSCRHLQRLSDELERKLIVYINSINYYDFFRRRRELLFSFSLSEGIGKSLFFCKIRLMNIYLIIFCSIVVLFKNPFVTLIYFMVLTIIYIIKKVIIDSITTEFNKALPINKLLIMYKACIMLLAIKALSMKSNGMPFIVANSSSSDILSIFIVILMIPYYEIYYLILESRILKLKESYKEIAFTIVGTLVVIMMGVIIKKFVSEKAIIIIVIIIAIIVAICLISMLFVFLNDLLFLNKLKHKDLSDRKFISEYFYKIRNSKVRFKYVELIKEKGIEVKGEWPDGCIPNIGDDESSTLLAQMEEKWLGLDR